MYLCVHIHFLKNNFFLKIQIKNILLYPFSLIYGLVISVRNWLFDQEIIRSTSFRIPIISVGNLVAGGTGKTPHTEFILSFLKDEWRSAVLSRGYKRSTKGFYLADENSKYSILGDESFQIHQKFPDVIVAVDEKRVHGVTKLLELVPDLQLVVLDDAFQHRYIEAGFSILLTDFANLYSRDYLLPAGNLREWKSGSKRADFIVVTKCPEDLKPIDMRVIEKELRIETNQQLFFSRYIYDEIVPVFPNSYSEKWTYQQVQVTQAGVLLVAGIVSPQSIVIHLENFTDTVRTLFFDDHHAFQPKDFSLITNAFAKITSSQKILLVTEKDAARLVSNPNFPDALKALTFAIPIRIEILHDPKRLFIQKIKNYVVENSRNDRFSTSPNSIKA